MSTSAQAQPYQPAEEELLLHLIFRRMPIPLDVARVIMSYVASTTAYRRKCSVCEREATKAGDRAHAIYAIITLSLSRVRLYPLGRAVSERVVPLVPARGHVQRVLSS